MTASPATEPVLVFDGRCGFCTRSVEWLLARVREPVRALPYQSLELDEWGLTEEQVRRAAWWIDTSGRRYRGAQAAARAFIACGPAGAWLGWLMRIPPIRWVAALVYVLVAKYRRHLPGTTPACKRSWTGRA